GALDRWTTRFGRRRHCARSSSGAGAGIDLAGAYRLRPRARLRPETCARIYLHPSWPHRPFLKGELDVHRSLWTRIGGKAVGEAVAAVAALRCRAVAGCRLVRAGDAPHREAAHREGIHARKLARSL